MSPHGRTMALGHVGYLSPRHPRFQRKKTRRDGTRWVVDLRQRELPADLPALT